MEIVRQTYSFLRRHRKSIGIVVGLSATGYAIYRVKRVLDDYKRLIKEHDVARVDHHRLQMHMLRSRGECIPALLNFMQTLKKRVNETVDVTTPVKALKTRRNDLTKDEEQLLWQQVKVSGFTRFFLAYYGFNLLNVMLRVQVHILGRYAFESSREEMKALQRKRNLIREGAERGGEEGDREGGSKDAFGNDDRYRLLSLVYEYFLGTGLRRLKEVVERVVTDELSDWSVHDKVKVSYTELHDVLSTIRRRLEGPRGITTAELPLLRFVVDMDAKTEELLGKLNEMVNETWDALESSSFKLAVEDCLDATYRVFLEDLHSTLYVPPSSPAPTSSVPTVSESGDESAEQQHETAGLDPRAQEEDERAKTPMEPPLAKLIAHMKNAASKIFQHDPQTNEYIRVTADNRSVNLLCSSFFTSELYM